MLDVPSVTSPDDVIALIEGFGEGFYAVDRDWRITFFNETAARHFRCPAQEAIGRVLWEAFPSAAGTALGDLFVEAMKQRQFVSSTTESVIFPGRWLSYRLFPFRNGMGVVFRDITDLRHARNSLRESEQRYRTLIENANDLVVTLDLNFTITSVNAAASRILGFDPHEIIGTPLTRYVPETQEATHRAMLDRKLAGEPSTAYEMTVFDRFGRARVLETNSRLSFNQSGAPHEIHAIARDVTEQRMAQQAVRASEERLRLAASAAGLGLFEIDWRRGKRFWSSEVCTIVGAPPEEISDDDSFIERTLSEPHLSRFQQKLAASMDLTTDGEIEDEYPIVRFDGSKGWIHLRGKTFFEEAEGARRPVRTIGLVVDITERKKSEETNALLAAVVRSSRDAIISLDTSERIRTWNMGAERLYGYTAAQAIGSPLALLVPGELAEEMQRMAAQVLAGTEIEFETVRRDQSGVLISVHISASPIRSPEGRIIGLSAVHRDISERKRHEEHLNFTIRELSHRTKNVLAVVQAIARQIGNRSLSLKQFQSRLSSSIQALAFCHDLLVDHGWKGGALDRLIELQLRPFGIHDGERLLMDGPTVILIPNATQLIGLALHELATNAAKYGALSSAEGTLKITWLMGRDGAVLFSWQEIGGPRVKAPRRTGFGTTVLHRTATALEGEASYDWRPQGLVWTIQIPGKHIWTE